MSKKKNSYNTQKHSGHIGPCASVGQKYILEISKNIQKSRKFIFDLFRYVGTCTCSMLLHLDPFMMQWFSHSYNLVEIRYIPHPGRYSTVVHRLQDRSGRYPTIRTIVPSINKTMSLITFSLTLWKSDFTITFEKTKMKYNWELDISKSCKKNW